MEEESKQANSNSFLARGCARIPKMYNNNRQIYDHGCAKLDAFNWLRKIEIAPLQKMFDCVEVRHKNSRKDFFRIRTFRPVSGTIGKNSPPCRF